MFLTSGLYQALGKNLHFQLRRRKTGKPEQKRQRKMKAIGKEEEEVNEGKKGWRKYERVRWLTRKAKKGSKGRKPSTRRNNYNFQQLGRKLQRRSLHGAQLERETERYYIKK